MATAAALDLLIDPHRTQIPRLDSFGLKMQLNKVLQVSSSEEHEVSTRCVQGEEVARYEHEKSCLVVF